MRSELAVAILPSRRTRQDAALLVEAEGLGRHTQLASELTDAHADTLDLPADGMSTDAVDGLLRGLIHAFEIA